MESKLIAHELERHPELFIESSEPSVLDDTDPASLIAHLVEDDEPPEFIEETPTPPNSRPRALRHPVHHPRAGHLSHSSARRTTRR